MGIERYSTFQELEERIGNSAMFLQEGYRIIAQGEKKESMPSVLYIDGITSAGKTTLLHNLTTEMPSATQIPEFLSSIPEQFRNISPYLSMANQLRAEFWFYNQYVQKNNMIQKCSGNVIVDRGILGLFCYSNLLGKQREVSVRIMRRAMQKQWVPGNHVFLTARPEIIRERLLTRNDAARITEDDWDTHASGFINILQESVITVAQEAGVHLVDTSDKTPEEVQNEVKMLCYDFFNTNS